MKKIITILGALTVASTPTIVLKNIAPHQTQNLLKAVTKKSNWEYNNISVSQATDYYFKFTAYLTNGSYNGFSGFLDQICFNLSDYNYHAWPLYFFQWLDDDDFHSGPMPGLNHHTMHGFWNRPLPYDQRLETYMGHFGSYTDDKSDTAYNMSTCWGQWGTFGQNVDNQWKADCAAKKPLVGVRFNFGFRYSQNQFYYWTETPSFNIIMAS